MFQSGLWVAQSEPDQPDPGENLLAGIYPWKTGMDASNQHAEVEVTVSNRQGFHARPITRFVDVAMGFSSDIKVQKDRETVDGKSPMEMMLLAAVQAAPPAAPAASASLPPASGVGTASRARRSPPP